MVTVTYTGYLRDTEHDVGGIVYVLDQDTLIIDKFSYDGIGFGVNINVADKGRNLKGYEKNRVSVPFPSGSGDATIEDKYDGDGQLVIDISQVGMKARDIKWLSIWCRDYQMSFGHVEF